jgi:hypothetical protein
MKIVDKIIGKIGVDKVLHFLVGALVTSYGSMVGDACMWVAVVLVVVCSIAKEVLDDKVEWMDIVAGCLGCVMTMTMTMTMTYL